MNARVLALWLGLMCGASAVAAAQPQPQPQADPTVDRAQASKHFDRGLELIERGAYPEAVAQFERAYQLSKNDAVLHNLGMAYAAAGRPVEAAATLARYLTSQGAGLEAGERARIEAELQRQRAQIGEIAIQVKPDGARIEIDDRKRGTSPLARALFLPVGEHTIVASHPDYESAGA